MPPLSSEEQKRLNHTPKKWIKEFLGFFGYDKETTEFTLDGRPTKTTKEHQRGKTLWDWLDLLLIPLLLAGGGWWFNAQLAQRSQDASNQQHKNDSQIALDKQRQDAFVAYQKDISDLMLTYKLDAPIVGSVASAKTLTVLRQLDPLRKGFVIKFIYDSRLIKEPSHIVSLQDADLRGINLGSSIGLNNPSSSIYGHSATGEPNGCNLSGINLQGADIKDASFKNADLSGAYLEGAYLGGADLSGANLQGAQITQEQLNKAKSLKGATMPDGSKHP